MLNPSLIAQSSANRLVVIPMFLEKALIHALVSEQRIPPPPALLGFPIEESSVLSLNQALVSLSQRIIFST